MAMTKHPSEVFGHPIDVDSAQARDHRKKHWCPFADDECNKQSRLIDYPMGVCSVQYGDEVIALSPRRFLQDKVVFYDIADCYFHTRSDLMIFPEISIPGASSFGRFDYVMVRHEELGSNVLDFAVVEFQTGQTTYTGRLVTGLEDFMEGENIKAASYGFGLNLADIWKRTFTQILTKGIVLERWGHKIYWVVQEPIYRDFLDRYQLHGMTYNPSHSTVFTIYDLRRVDDKYELYQTRLESSTIDDLFNAFRTNFAVPSKDAFVNKLKQRIEKSARAKMHLKLELG